jgi:ABC-type transport system involved in cytochrome bd biosynthesis fused ATPase/permease subunit
MKSYIGLKKFIINFQFLLGEKIKKFYLIIVLYLFLSILDLINITLIFAFTVSIFENSNLNLPIFFELEISQIIQNNVEIVIFLIFFTFLCRSFFYVFLNKRIIRIKFALNIYLTQRLATQFFKKQNAEILNKYKSSIFFESIISWTSAFHEKVFAVITKFIGEFVVLINILIFSSLIISKYLLLLVVGLLLLYFLFYTFFISKFFFNLSFKIKNISLNLIQFTKDMFSNFNIIHDLDLSQFMLENINNIKKRFFGYHMQQEVRNIQIKVFVELIYISIFCLIIYIIFKTNSDNNFSQYILLFYGIYRSKPLIDLFSVAKSRTLSSISQMENLANILKELEFDMTKKVEKKLNFSKNIYLKNINLINNRKIIFKDLEIYLDKGKKVVITGPSGSGKSTLAKILNGSLKVKDINIFIDDSNYKNLNLNTFYLPQNPFIIDGSLKKNIVFKENVVDENKFADCLQLSHLKKEILVQNQDFNFENQISQGEKQRIGIARAFYFNNFDIYIFDESTSGLDSNTEEFIIKNILNQLREKTIIFITHNINVIKNFDIHYKIQNSKLVKVEINEKINK